MENQDFPGGSHPLEPEREQNYSALIL